MLQFSTEKNVKAAADDYFGKLEESHFRDVMTTLEHRWMKGIELKEEL